MKRLIYADNASTTKLDPDAYRAMAAYLEGEFANPSSAYTFAQRPKQALRDARRRIADLLGAPDGCIYFTASGTESDNWAIKGIAEAAREKGKHLVTSQIEHHAVLHSCRHLESLGYEVTYLPVNGQGQVEKEVLAAAIRPDTILVSIMAANNEMGALQSIGALAETARAHGVPFHTDAVQAVGHIPINLSTWGADLLSASAHKFGGPKGVGFLYVKSGIVLSPLIDGGAQESKMRAGTENVAGIVGMDAALQKSVSMIEEQGQRMHQLTEALILRLREANIDFIQNGHSTERLPGLLSLSFRDQDGEAMLHWLDLKGICVSTGSACNAAETEVSHIIEALCLPPAYREGTIRISFGLTNTIDDATAVAEALIRYHSIR